MRTVGKPKKGTPRPTGQELYELYLEQRKTQQEIADLYGVRTCSVVRWVRRYGLQKWKTPERNKDWAYILEQHEAGKTREQIARDMGVSVSTIDRRKNRAKREREQG